MEMVFIVGKMAEVTKGNTFMIKNTDMAYTHGLTEEDTRVIGRTGKDKERGNTYCHREYVGRVFGIKIKESNGRPGTN
jgi:hypothetical protein